MSKNRANMQGVLNASWKLGKVWLRQTNMKTTRKIIHRSFTHSPEGAQASGPASLQSGLRCLTFSRCRTRLTGHRANCVPLHTFDGSECLVLNGSQEAGKASRRPKRPCLHWITWEPGQLAAWQGGPRGLAGAIPCARCPAQRRPFPTGSP